IWILIEREDIGACFQDRFAVSAAAAGSIQDQDTRTWRQQFDRFAHEDRSMINKFFPVLCFFLKHERPGREPNRTFKEQSIHLCYNPMTLATCWLVGVSSSLARFLRVK